MVKTKKNNKRERGERIMDRVNNIQSGDVLVTTNGNFMIVRMECCGQDEEGYFRWCAMYVDDEGDHPLEIQYMTSDDDPSSMIEQIERDGQIYDIDKGKVVVVEGE